MPCPQCGYHLLRGDTRCPRCTGGSVPPSVQSPPPLQMQQPARPPSATAVLVGLVIVAVLFVGLLQLRQWSIDSQVARDQAVYDRFSDWQSRQRQFGPPPTDPAVAQFDAQYRQQQINAQTRLQQMQQQNAQRMPSLPGGPAFGPR